MKRNPAGTVGYSMSCCLKTLNKIKLHNLVSYIYICVCVYIYACMYTYIYTHTNLYTVYACTACNSTVLWRSFPWERFQSNNTAPSE
uniref:Uncharacterized protein n=1 Tax=Anguilla anguilla TaxID=7936 RepID=A0A0E9WIV4_ANGAN